MLKWKKKCVKSVLKWKKKKDTHCSDRSFCNHKCFFVRFLVFELLSILYFTLLTATWDLGVQQGSSVAWLCKICRWRYPIPTRVFKFLLSPTKKNTKLIISQKLRIAHKKSHSCKKLAPDQFQSTLANFATFEKSCIFGAPFGNLWRPTRYDVIWSFMPIIFFSTLYIFYVELATSERGPEGGVGGVSAGP